MVKLSLSAMSETLMLLMSWVEVDSRDLMKGVTWVGLLRARAARLFTITGWMVAALGWK